MSSIVNPEPTPALALGALDNAYLRTRHHQEQNYCDDCGDPWPCSVVELMEAYDAQAAQLAAVESQRVVLRSTLGTLYEIIESGQVDGAAFEEVMDLAMDALRESETPHA